MTCKSSILIALALSGCANDVPTLYATGIARMSTLLDPPDDQIPTSLGHYRWELLEEPVTADLPTLFGDQTATIVILPPGRGIYVLDRWFVTAAAEQLSYHVVVTVEGVAPSATFTAPDTLALGQPAMFDGYSSSSPETRMLSYEWRLFTRPEGSMAAISDVSTPTTKLTPDLGGSYEIELRVFDGELWSKPATVALTAQ